MPARMYLAAEKDAQCRYAALRHKSTTHTHAGHIIAHFIAQRLGKKPREIPVWPCPGKVPTNDARQMRACWPTRPG